MQNKSPSRRDTRPQRHRPAYLVESVDNALRLIELLRDRGTFTVSEVAEVLDVAPSTAHRLLAMLVYRGFAAQDERRRYHPGPSLEAPPVRVGWTRQLRDIAAPHLELLCSRVDETVNLMIRVGTTVRFLDTVETSKVLRIGDREGAVLPAHQASGGKVLLADLETPVLSRLYCDPRDAGTPDHLSPEQFAELEQSLAEVRRRGYAVNSEETEEGVMAIATGVRVDPHKPGNAESLASCIAAVSIAVPKSRFTAMMGSGALQQLRYVCADIEGALRDAGLTTLDSFP